MKKIMWSIIILVIIAISIVTTPNVNKAMSENSPATTELSQEEQMMILRIIQGED